VILAKIKNSFCKKRKIALNWRPVMKISQKELEITRAVINSDKKAFEYFYTGEYKRALFYVNQYLNDLLLAEDITQDSFATLWDKRVLLDPSLPLLPYLYSILKNKSLNELRRISNSRRLNDEIKRREYKANLVALTDDSSDTVVRFQLEEFISSALKEMPEKFSDSFLQSRVNGLSYKEIAEKKEISVKTVEYHITQAIKYLKYKLKDFL